MNNGIKSEVIMDANMNILIRYTVFGIPFTVVAPDSAKWSNLDCLRYVESIHASAVVTSIER